MFKKPTLNIEINGQKLICMNYMKKTVVKLDKGAAAFFQHRISDARDRVTTSPKGKPSCLVSPTDTGTDASGTDTSSSGFSFGSSKRVRSLHESLNIRGEIWWHPSTFSWRITSKDTTATTNYPVDQSLRGEAFKSAVTETWKVAATAWNALDNSKKNKIVIHNHE